MNESSNEGSTRGTVASGNALDGLPGLTSSRGSIGRQILLFMRRTAITVRMFWLRRLLGMDLHPSCRCSLKANLDLTNPSGIHIGADTYIAFGAVILSHDMVRRIHTDTRIGRNCFIGAHAIVLPGVSIGDECIVGAGSVVSRDVPANSIAAGNPARVLRSGISAGKWGVLE